MTRRLTLVALAAAALLLVGCEINTNYDLDIAADGSSIFELEVAYDDEASQLFGTADAFLSEIEEDTEGDIDGVRVLSAEADSSDPENQRVAVTLEVDTPEALDELMADNFEGSFTNEGGDTYRLVAQPDMEAAEFGELGELGGEGGDEIPFDFGFIGGSLTLSHEGSQVSMSGGESGSGNTVTWDPFGEDELVVVMDLSGESPAGSGQEEAPDESAAQEEPAEEPVEEEPEAAEQEIEAIVAEDDDEGFGFLTIALIAGGILLAILIAIIVAVVMRKKGKGTDDAAMPAYAGAAAAPGVTAAGGYAQPPGQAPPSAPQPPPAQASPPPSAPQPPPAPPSPPPAVPQAPPAAPSPPPAAPEPPPAAPEPRDNRPPPPSG